ncbi:ATP-binding cassette domain-containing protein [Thermanaerosceptrum fracticalcis]|jgi:cobalt/nickel transport system ATP-binding protein|uniref:ABC transporter ATP-binding protein n=1 Tax=Thermanaerosceptrum fracticalcis TaxID=1712410 RepID=A0A7G6E7R7_THEFR|nr:ATP-binding cassette domain-containing protein [Thermanaerosceptrum fracticalcis]QNB48121.1 ATP-binding cassette domain-containing protein [Thermanaerosceptrum fracticalcis]
MSDYIMRADKLEYTYPDGTKALRGLTLALPRGKRIAFLGPNGAGKSTFFLHLNGLNRPSRGSLFFQDQPYRYDGKSLKQLRQQVGLVFQDPDNQLFSASVSEDVAFGPFNLELPAQEITRRVETALRITNLWELKDKPTHFLSVGQKKRVALAGVLAMKPEVIVLDEPTANLDPKHTGIIMNILTELNNAGKTIIISTHDLDIALSWADYLFVLKNGGLLAEGTPREIFANEAVLQEAELEKPLIWRVYQELLRKGYLEEGKRIPHSIHELLTILR